jgi:hypothetical protein
LFQKKARGESYESLVVNTEQNNQNDFPSEDYFPSDLGLPLFFFIPNLSLSTIFLGCMIF